MVDEDNSGGIECIGKIILIPIDVVPKIQSYNPGCDPELKLFNSAEVGN